MLAAFSVTPLGTGESVGGQVAEAVRIVRASGLPSETNGRWCDDPARCDGMRGTGSVACTWIIVWWTAG